MGEREKNIEDVEFILRAIVEHGNRTNDEVREFLQMDPLYLFYRIHLPEGRELRIGAEGNQRLYDLAKRFLNSRKQEKADADLNKFVVLVGEEITRFFVIEKRALESETIMKALVRAHKRVSKTYKPVTYFIPCEMISSGRLEAFNFGSVLFTPTREFCSRNQNEFAKWGAQSVSEIRDDDSKEQLATSQQDRMDKVLQFFSRFAWVAQISIQPCSESVSRERALFGIRNALNGMKLIFGSRYSDRFRTADDFGFPRETSWIYCEGEEGKFEIGSRYVFPGNPLGDEWMQFLSGRAAFHSEILQKVIRFGSEKTEVPFLCERFPSALSWFGDAVSEPLVAAKIVKFVSAIESMVGTGPDLNDKGEELRGVTSIVTSRAAIFYANGSDLGYISAKAELKKLYQSRSDLVHGSTSPRHESLPRIASKASKIAQIVLLVGLDYFESIGLDDPHTLKKLRHLFDELEKQASSPVPSCQEASPDRKC